MSSVKVFLSDPPADDARSSSSRSVNPPVLIEARSGKV